jgi:hypothetical protein
MRDLNQCFRGPVTMFKPSRLALAEEEVASGYQSRGCHGEQPVCPSDNCEQPV